MARHLEQRLKIRHPRVMDAIGQRASVPRASQVRQISQPAPPAGCRDSRKWPVETCSGRTDLRLPALAKGEIDVMSRGSTSKPSRDVRALLKAIGFVPDDAIQSGSVGTPTHPRISMPINRNAM